MALRAAVLQDVRHVLGEGDLAFVRQPVAAGDQAADWFGDWDGNIFASEQFLDGFL